MCVATAMTQAQADPVPIEQVAPVVDNADVGALNFLKSNWAELLIALMAFAKVIVRLTPTLKDDKVFGWLDDLIAFFIPNIKKKT